MMQLLAVALGGAAGSVARYGCNVAFVRALGSAFPYGTLFVNSVGSFVILFFLTFSLERTTIDPVWRLLVVTGFLGGFTTFSSFAYETFSFAQQGEFAKALANVLLNNILGLFCSYLGLVAAKALSQGV